MIKPTKSQSAFYYHHVPTVLNIAIDKVLFPEELRQPQWLLLNFNNVRVSFKLSHFNNLTVSKHCILHGSYSESHQLFSGFPTHMELATHVPFENQFRTVGAVRNCVNSFSARTSHLQPL